MAALLSDAWTTLESPESRQATLRQLDTLSPQAVLREISALIASVANAASLPLDLRIKLVRELEEAAQRHIVPCTREYLTPPHRSEERQEEEFELWRTNREFWMQLASAYSGCLNAYREHLKEDALHKVELTRLAVSLLRAYGARLKWDQYRYGPHSEALWQFIGRAYLSAVAEGVDRRLATVAHAGKVRETTVEQEYLRIVMFQACSMDSLLPIEVDVAERLITLFLPMFSFGQERNPDDVYWIDANKRRGPTRLLREPPESETLRYVGAGRALSGLAQLQEALEKGEAPAALNLGRSYSSRIILPVVRHLAAYWSPHPPRREFDRYNVSSRLTVVSGLRKIHERLRQTADQAQSGAEWRVRNVSRNGLGVNLPLADQAATTPVQIGTLLGMQPEDGEHLLVGVVRRFARESNAQACIGIETLAKKAVPLEIDSAGRSSEALLLDSLENGQIVRMALPSGAASAMTPLTANVEGKTAHFTPVELVERGVAFNLTRYRVDALA